MSYDIEISKIQSSRVSTVDFSNIEFGKVLSDHMFISEYNKSEWQSSRIEPYAPIPLLPAVTVLHYAQSVFEGMKAFCNKNNEIVLFRPEKNFKRLNSSCRRLCIPEISKELFFDALDKLLTIDKQWVPKEPGMSLYIRPFIFGSDEYVGIRPSDTYKFIIFTCPVGAYYSEPVRVKIETQYTRAPQSGGTGSVKASGNYAGTLYPAKLAKEQGYDQLIWTDSNEHKFIEEAGTMNLFFVIDNVLITPKTSDSILPGITRDSIIEIAKGMGVKVEEREISVEEIIKAAKDNRLQEAFGAGTAATITQIKTIGYNNEDYNLPSVNSDNFSKKALNYLDDLKLGNIEDTKNWIYIINNS